MLWRLTSFFFTNCSPTLFASHPLHVTIDQDGCTTTSYIWPIIHPYYIDHLHHFIHLKNSTERLTNRAPSLSTNTIPPYRSPFSWGICLYVCTSKSPSYYFGKCINIFLRKNPTTHFSCLLPNGSSYSPFVRDRTLPTVIYHLHESQNILTPTLEILLTLGPSSSTKVFWLPPFI